MRVLACAAPPPWAVMGDEWSLVKVVLHADKDKTPEVYQPANYTGCGNDKAVCIFCGNEPGSLRWWTARAPSTTLSDVAAAAL